ncbi:metallophosphoesterase family protein [Chelatococcus reniformis]|uniref:Calcineurin-like phosphoesterase domain-containing protein n=1 Tax=Chelatococcus reniformis TaxID=1494448 RepID=A0A916UHL2_9HYPH|nr:metallophosphoesterase [Chelatococcus reniformis]GGC73199.1 hypothetical protein GCM10010994_34490 [Chelatococcus reniformis]
MPEGSLTVIQLTDLHLSPSRPFFLANWRAAARDAQRAEADLIVISGDLTINGADWEADLTHAMAELRPLEPLCVPGNHDIGECRPDHDQAIDAVRLERYRRLVGPDYWYRDQGAWRIVGLNTQLMASGLPDETAQRAWAEAVIPADGRFIAVFLHKPLYVETVDGDDEPDHAVPGEARRWLAGLLAHPAVRLVSCGHVHQYRVRTLAAAKHVWAPATSFLTHHDYGGEHVPGLLTWRLGADGQAEHELSVPEGLRRLQLEDIRGDFPNLRSLTPAAVAAAMNRHGLAAARPLEPVPAG